MRRMVHTQLLLDANEVEVVPFLAILGHLLDIREDLAVKKADDLDLLNIGLGILPALVPARVQRVGSRVGGVGRM